MRNRPHIKVAASIAAAVALVAGCGTIRADRCRRRRCPGRRGDYTGVGTSRKSAGGAVSRGARGGTSSRRPAAEATDHRVTYDWAAPSGAGDDRTPGRGAYAVPGRHLRRRPLRRRTAVPTARVLLPGRDSRSTTSSTCNPSSVRAPENRFPWRATHSCASGSSTRRPTTTPASRPSRSLRTTHRLPKSEELWLRGRLRGHLTYGLGLQVAPNSDQVLLVRAGELTKSDGAGGCSTSSTSISRLVESHRRPAVRS